MVWKYDNNFYKSVRNRGFEASEVVLRILSDYFSPASIIDYGCGLGTWTFAAGNQFPEAEIMGLDLNTTQLNEVPSSKKFSNIRFKTINFEEKNTVYSKCDLAICLEVVEHISLEQAKLHIARMCNSSNIILFSGAVKGQGGTGHINEQSIEYWVNQFKALRWIPVDIIRPEISENKNVPNYYRNNILVFVPIENLGLILKDINNPSVREKFLHQMGLANDIRSLKTKVLHSLVSKLSVELVSRIASIKDKFQV